MDLSPDALSEFLLQRIAEDVEASYDTRVHAGPGSPDRIRADAESKRRIVERCIHIQTYDDHCGWVVDETLRLLALPYADHPDYRVEWRE